MPKAITLEKFEERKNKKFSQFKTIHFKNMTSPYTFYCPTHKEQTTKDCYIFLNSKCGCPECFKEDKSKNNKDIIPKRVKYNNEELKNKLIEINGERYDYHFPDYNVGTRGIIKVFCKKHGYLFDAAIYNLLRGNKCRLCANEERKKIITKSKEFFLSECIDKFGDIYEYDLSGYENGLSYIIVKCKKCGFTRNIIAKSFLGGAGICPVCDDSSGETAIRRILTDNNINFKQHYYGFKECKYKNKLEFDFYLPDKNTVIEYQGEQHYYDNGWKRGNEFKEQQTRDQIKREFCESNGIKEIEIPYWELNNIENVLKEELVF